MQWLIGFLKSAAVPVTPPRAYGVFHLCFFIAGVLLCALLAFRLRRTDERQNKRVLLFVGLCLLLFELYKQAFQYFAIGYETYPFGIFPFHICSTPMYLCIAAGLLRPGRLQSALQNYIATFGFIGGFTSFFEPSGLLHGYWVQTMHSMLWHMILVFLGFYLWASGRVGAQKYSFKDAVLVFAALVSVAFILNIIFYNASNGTMNMFFIGPGQSTLIVFSEISRRFGWYISTPLLIGCLIFAAYLVYYPNRRRHLAQQLQPVSIP